MKQTLYCQIVSDSLPIEVGDIHKFNAKSLLSADVLNIAYICYNMENLMSSHI